MLARKSFGLRDCVMIIFLDVEKITIFCDHQSAIFLANNATFHDRTKHIDVQYHFVLDMVEYGKVNLEKVDTLANVAYALTKPMSIENFKCYFDSMGLGALRK
jgi:hypothetical protein